MLKAGIVTFASAHNYGALLQAYAMQRYLENLGIEAHIINYRPKEIDNVYKLYRIKKTKNFPKKVIMKISKVIKIETKEKWRKEKYINFERFIDHTLKTTRPYNKLGQIQASYLDYDILIAGSDQIWNTDLTKGFKPAYFLEFGKKDAIRIAYAASLGRNDIDKKYILFYKRYLKNFDYISVREKSMISIFNDLTDKEVVQVLDPTLLLNKKDYNQLKKESKYKDKEYIYVHFIGKDSKLIEIADKVSTELNIPILHNFANKIFKNELDYHYNESPEKIIDVVKNAKMVITNSFHLTVLSIIYNKKFITIPHAKRPERMKNLLEMLDLEDHLIEDVRIMPDLKELEIDYDKVEKKLENERKKSVEFLQKALFNKKPQNIANYFTEGDKFDCYGCGVCASICPKNAIRMVEDEEGFVYPKIDAEKCINCKLCEKKCIYKNNSSMILEKFDSKVYAVINKDKSVIKNSTSGGVFTALYKKTISENGCVVGVKYNENMEPVYDMAFTEKECEKFRGAKYVAAKLGDIKEKTKNELESGKSVLFVGNPCQIVGLKRYLNKEYDNLYLVEIICHGTPSSKVFAQYINAIEKKYKLNVINFECRNKKTGWQKSSVKVTFEDGTEKYEPVRYNNFTRAFLNKYISRPSCYNCEFTGDNKQSDITIGDFWGIDNIIPGINNDTGISLLKINNKKGEEIFSNISNQIEFYKSNYKDGYRANHKFPIVLNLRRIKLMEEIDDMDMDKLLSQYNQFKSKKNKNKKIKKRSI